jgi:hypothetical protein
MAFSRSKIVTQVAQAIAASGSSVLEFYFPKAVRIRRYFGISSVAEAAHSTQASDLTFVNAGTDGSGTTELAILTNDSDLADSTVRESGAWVAHDAKEVDCEARPGSPTNAQNVQDEIAAGTVIKVTHAKASGTTTGNMIAGIEYVESDYPPRRGHWVSRSFGCATP